MADLVKIIDNIRHEQFRPLYQSLKSHMEIAHNQSLHISPTVLKDVIKRMQEIEQKMMLLLN